MIDPKDGQSWRAFSQSNFTAVVLLGLLMLSMASVVVLMHEDKIDDKYVTWLEGFAMGVFSTLNLALRSANSGQHQGDTIRTGDNATVVTAPDPAQPDPDPAIPLAPSGIDRP